MATFNALFPMPASGKAALYIHWDRRLMIAALGDTDQA